MSSQTAMSVLSIAEFVLWAALGFLFWRKQLHSYFPVYFIPYWAVYIGSAGALFFVCMEVFRSALSAFSGLMKFGLVIFRWAVLASVIVTFSSISFAHRGLMLLPDIAYALMRSVSILELCLLAFLCLSMNALRLPIRDMAFGISLGFGLRSEERRV